MLWVLDIRFYECSDIMYEAGRGRMKFAIREQFSNLSASMLTNCCFFEFLLSALQWCGRCLCFGLIEEKVVAANEKAYEVLCSMEKQLLDSDSDEVCTFSEKYVLRIFMKRKYCSSLDKVIRLW